MSVRRWGLCLSLWFAGCGGGGSPTLIVYRLLARPPVMTGTSGMHLGCEIGGEMREAIGCVPRASLAYEKDVAVNTPVMWRRYPVPPAAIRRSAAVERAWRPSGTREWHFLPAINVRTAAAGVSVPFDGRPAAVTHVDLQATIYLLDRPPPHRKSRPVTVARGAVLAGGYALANLGPTARPGRARFRIAVRQHGRQTVLLDDVVEPGSPAATAWTDYRFDLDRFAGAPMRVVFSATGPRERGTPILGRATLPVWTVPTVSEPRVRPVDRNVVLVSLDTLRADHLGTYGFDLPTSPRLDAFARGATVFERAVTTYPSTTAAHASMLTGVYPSVHGAWGVMSAIAPDVPLLAERLEAEGYRTLAVTEDAMLSHLGGFRRGFARYREFRGSRDDDGMPTPGFFPDGVDTALSWMAQQRDERVFLFLHTYAVHGPYTPPPAFDVFTTYRDAHGVERPIDASTAPGIRDEHLYDGEILAADHEIGRLLDGLEELGRRDDTIVIVTGDHGEAFDGSHGFKGHGLTLAEEVLHVPLLIAAPGLVPAGRRVAPPVSLVDVPATILALLGRDVPPSMQGRSLVPLLTDPIPAELAERAVYSEMHYQDATQLAVHQGTRKWILGTTPFSGDQMYDLASDPDERARLDDGREWARGQKLSAEFFTLVAAQRGGQEAPVESVPTPDVETTEKLRALGYLH